MKKNYNKFVEFQKVLGWIKENKLLLWVIILFLLTFKWDAGNVEGKFKWSIGCAPLRITDVKEILK